MRILQLIDSLEPGGAERMAVNYANTLASKIEFSGLVATRKEGSLKNQIAKNVWYQFLDRKKTVDFKAVFRLRKFIKQHKVQVIHAHSTSFFLACLLKLTLPQIKLVWHDHFGNRAQQKKSKNKILVICSYLFTSIIAVNEDVQLWDKNNLGTRKVDYLPNFTVPSSEIPVTVLNGNEGKRIVCLSNLHHPKNHLMLLAAFVESKMWEAGWTLHLIGKDNNDEYSERVKKYIVDKNANFFIFTYGSCSDVYHVLRQSSVAVLASVYEGFPVTLLEYGLSKLPVLCSNVGYCNQIIENGKSGFLFDPLNLEEIKVCLIEICNNSSLRSNFAENLYQFVKSNYSEEIIVEEIIKHYKSLF